MQLAGRLKSANGRDVSNLVNNNSSCLDDHSAWLTHCKRMYGKRVCGPSDIAGIGSSVDIGTL